MKNLRKWLVTSFCTLFVLGFLVNPSPAFSDDEGNADRSPAASKKKRGSTEYDFSWLDPDKKIYVLQNRRYLKADRIQVSALFGLTVNGNYRDTFTIDPRLTYYFTEEWGAEFFYNFSFNSENSAFEALSNSSPNALPVVREFSNTIGLLAVWSPWYAKINVFNSILYFDWYFTLGAGSASIELDTRTNVSDNPQITKENPFAIYVGTGHQYHVNEEFIVRLDFMGTIYAAPLFGLTGDDTWFTVYNFNIGAGYRF